MQRKFIERLFLAKKYTPFEGVTSYRRHFSILTKFKSMNAKPPNIFVYTANSSESLYKAFENDIMQCIDTQNYLIYNLLDAEVKKQIWIENTLLLVLYCNTIDDSYIPIFEKYISSTAGNVLIICSRFHNLFAGYKCMANTANERLVQVNYKNFRDSYLFYGDYTYISSRSIPVCVDSNNKPIITKTKFDNCCVITAEVYIGSIPDTRIKASNLSNCNYENSLLILKDILVHEFGLKAKDENYNIPKLSPGYVIASNEIKIVSALNKMKLENSSSQKSMFYECTLKYTEKEIKLPIFYLSEENFCSFNKNLYFNTLKTNVYGQQIIFFPVITTTMDIAAQLSVYDGIVIVANSQLSGKGRSSNKWISPVGCAMFTLHFLLPLCSNLGKKLPLIQHMASLAVVHGIKSYSEYKNLNLKIKWPNDIYYENMKIGGLIVSTTVEKCLAHVYIGWGINVSNSRPTFCINDVIDKYNSEKTCSLPHMHTEEVIALTLTQMEYFVHDFMEFGPSKFLSHYYSYWMHSDQKVTLTNLNEEGIISGLNDFGFLVVKTTAGKEIILQPDGNRFDIMKNLIYVG